MSDRDRQPAPKDGIQTVNGLRFRAVRGELMLPGAVFSDPAQEAKDAQNAADDAKAKADAAKADAAAKAAAEKAAADDATKAKGGKGPDDTTDSSGPSKTS